jgi:hypothetical protein
MGGGDFWGIGGARSSRSQTRSQVQMRRRKRSKSLGSHIADQLDDAVVDAFVERNKAEYRSRRFDRVSMGSLAAAELG